MTNLYDFINQGRLFKKLKVDNLLFAEYKCLVEEDRGEIWSHTNYFAFGIKGKKIWQTINGKYFVNQGKLLFIKKGANPVYQYFEEEFIAFFIFIPDDFIKSVIDKHQPYLRKVRSVKRPDSIIPVETDEVLFAYFHSLLYYLTKEKPISKSLIKLKFEELILSLITNPNNSLLIKCFKEIYENSKISVKEIMEANYRSNLTLQEYAKLSARSLSTFKRDFFSIYKKTPGKWIIEKRLAHSRHLLQYTNKSIDEIICDSGFKSRSHFIKVFKNKFGITPNRLRTSGSSLRKVI